MSGTGKNQASQNYSDRLVVLLKACAKEKNLESGIRLHADIIRRGLAEKNVYIGNSLVNLYAKCGALAKAQGVFDGLPIRTVVSWNALIAGYAQHGYGQEALDCFEQMQSVGLPPNEVTFVCILKACGSLGAAGKGQEIHAKIVRVGLLDKNILVGNALVDMYAKCGALAKAQEVFDDLPARDVISWSALISGYAQFGHGQEALNCFKQMEREGLSPNTVTFLFLLKACGSIRATDKGQDIHTKIAREGLLEKDILVGTAVVDMYAKCGAVAKAQEAFDRLPVRNIVSWSALIAGYAQHGQNEEALNCFEQMRCEGLRPDAFIYVIVLKACGSLGAADKGQEIHAEIVHEGWLRKDSLVGTALVDMYAKCGELAKAQGVFDELPVYNVVSWTALMTGYSQLGKHEIVFKSFNKMIEESIEPSMVTFIILLNTCSHAGLLDKGQKFFETMRTGYGITPTVDHYACMVDLYGRAGHLDKAAAMIDKMPFSANLMVWLTILGACWKWINVTLGRLAFEHAIQLDEKDAAAYVCMSNIYCSAGMQEDAEKIEATRVKKEAWKMVGHCWWTNGIVHSCFTGGHLKRESLLV